MGVYVLEYNINKEEGKNQEFPNAKAAATAAWDVCARHSLDMPSEEWTYDHPRFGVQTCFNMMVPAGRDWEPNTAFIDFMSKQARRNGRVEIDGGEDWISIYSKEIESTSS